MKVLVACEFSGIVRNAFIEEGHDAWSCDIEPSSDKGNHIQDDVLNVLNDGWDLMVAHPPCTYLCISGIRWMYNEDGTINLERKVKQDEALEFVKALMFAPIDRIAIENPIGVISSKLIPPTQTIKPYMFGDDSSKSTCLWLKNLPKLFPTNIIKPTFHISSTGRKWDSWFWNSSLISDYSERSKMRSTTFKGIANAMSIQWGNSKLVQTNLSPNFDILRMFV